MIVNFISVAVLARVMYSDHDVRVILINMIARTLGPRPHVAGYFRKRRFFSPYLKISASTRSRVRIVCAEERALSLGMTSLHLKASVFAHEYDESPFSKLSTLESVFENLRFRCPKTPVMCGWQAYSEKKVSVFQSLSVQQYCSRVY